MAAHGNIEEFDHSLQDWTQYCERLEKYFLSNDVKDATKQCAILLSVSSSATYRLVRNLVAPAKLTDKLFNNIVELVHDHYTPKPSMIAQRFQFHCRSQKEGESIAKFTAELRQLSEHSQFEAVLNNMLHVRDRLVCGVRDVRIQHCALAEPDLKFKKAL